MKDTIKLWSDAIEVDEQQKRLEACSTSPQLQQNMMLKSCSFNFLREVKGHRQHPWSSGQQGWLLPDILKWFEVENNLRIILRNCGQLCKIQLNQNSKENTTKKSKCISWFFFRHVSNFSTRKWLSKLWEHLVQQPMMWSDSQTWLKQTPSLKPSLDFACSYQLLQLLYCKWCWTSNATLSIKPPPASRFYSFTGICQLSCFLRKLLWGISNEFIYVIKPPKNMISLLSFVSF